MTGARAGAAALLAGSALLAAPLMSVPPGSAPPVSALPGSALPGSAPGIPPPATVDGAAAFPPESASPPPPPPVGTDPPTGHPPGAVAGLRAPEHCDPPAAGAGPAEDGSERLQLDAVHRLATGKGQLIAVIDTGVWPHERFGSRLLGGGDYLTGGDGLDDCDGHGTAVAGILAAGPDTTGPGDSPRSTDGFVGMAPDARLLAIRQSSPSFTVPGPDGTARPAGDTDTLADAIVLAVRHGATVVNISEAVCLPPEQAAPAGDLVHAALRLAARSGVVVVAAAGNAGVGSCVDPGQSGADTQVSLPGWYDAELLTVAAVGRDDAAAPFSVPGPWVDVAAPGTELRSLAVGGETRTGVQGTSFAAPWVSGLAALVRERFPELTARQVVDRIVATARRPANGRDDQVGHGVVDPVAALTAVPAVLSPVTGAGPAPPVELHGTAPRDVGESSRSPIDLLAAGALLALVVGAAVLARRRPGLSSRPAARRPPGPPAPGPAPGRSGAAAWPPPERARPR